tara:strand:+ start:143 stop:1300 length:1158 start_codon:yes stop_codon:yes gene_type:complete
MVVRKKRKPSKNIKNKGIVKKNNSASKKINSNFVFKNSSLNVFLRMVVKFPYVFINKTSSFVIQFLLGFFSVFRQMITFSLKIKEAIFGVLFGLLSGSIASVVIYSYFNYNSQIDNAINDQNIIDNTNMLEKISSLEGKIEQIVSQNKTNKIKIDKISNIENQLTVTIQNSEDNYDKIITVNEEIKDISKKSEIIQKDLVKLEQNIINNSKLMMSSSKTELSNRLYLAQSLVDRLKSGVPYSPQLTALGVEGLDPALLRYANGGAPTLSALAARLSARAGELKDADKTMRDVNWRDNLRSEISKYVKIRPTDIQSIKGTSGALLRAEDAISKGNLEKAINEVDSLTPNDRGALNAWLSEAKARHNANIAAENLLAKTTAALRKLN